jgi:hypothetical protein
MIKGTVRLLTLLCCVLSAAEESRAVSSHGLDAPCMANTAFAAFPAAMPEFKNEKQLATWRAEQASKADNHLFIHRLRGFSQITDEGSCRPNTSIMTALLLENLRQSAKSADNHFSNPPLSQIHINDTPCRHSYDHSNGKLPPTRR